MSQNDLCLYNDGSPTFLHSSNGTYTAIYLSFASPNLFERFSWDVHEDCSGSDYLPIILRSIETNVNIHLSDGNSNKQTGQLLKHFALLNLIGVHSDRMNPSQISEITFSKLLIKTISKSSISSKSRKPGNKRTKKC